MKINYFVFAAYTNKGVNRVQTEQTFYFCYRIKYVTGFSYFAYLQMIYLYTLIINMQNITTLSRIFLENRSEISVLFGP